MANDPNDNVLHVGALQWLAGLPADLRAIATARQYPLIINQVADLWNDCESTRLYFQSLLIHQTTVHVGVPPEVRNELEALQHYYFEYLSGMPAHLWNAVPANPRRFPDNVVPLRARKTEQSSRADVGTLGGDGL